MTSQQRLRWLRPLGLLGVLGLLATGCAIQDPPAIVELQKARKAIDTARDKGFQKQCPAEFADLERRHLNARGVFYACNDDEALKLAQAILNEAGGLDARCGVKAGNRPPIAQLLVPPRGDVNQVIAMDGSASSDPDGDALTYIWDFGDGETARFAFPRTTHRYAKPGSYLVKLTVDDGKGGTNTATAPINIGTALSAGALFDTGKSIIKPAGIQALAPVVQALRDQPTLRADIVGHTDSVGSDQSNLRLSLRRAEAVRNYLVSQGINAARLSVDGKGETQPVASNDTADGRARNRRVEIGFRQQGVQ